MTTDPIPRPFYQRDVVQVARGLLGKVLVRESEEGLVAGRIVETEAYKARNDPACHAARGRTRRNATMFGPPGRAYVYSIHSRYCLNVVTQAEGTPSAVLIRAIQPLIGIDLMQQRRGIERLLDVARGPGRLCEALALDARHDGMDITDGSQLWISQDSEGGQRVRVGRATRIGVSSAQDLMLRFFERGNEYVSGPRRIVRG